MPRRREREVHTVAFVALHICALNALSLAYMSMMIMVSRASLTILPLRFMGGNSTKATSGINGAGTQSQQDLGIPDSAKLFFEDTKRSVS